MRRRAAVVAVVWSALFSALVLSPFAPSADAAPPAQQGWWKQTLTIGTIDLLALLDPSTLDVPPDGLYVAGGSAANAPRAMAALTYDLGGGELAGPLRLATHPLGVTVPGSGAMACPLDRPTFTPAQGGPITTAPAYDCLGAVPSTIDADGAYLFDVTTLVRGGVVAVAILPTSAASRIVFASPTDGSLPVRAVTSGSQPLTDDSVPVEESAPVTGDTPSFGRPSAVSPPVGTMETPVAAAPVAVPAGRASSSATASKGSLGRAYALLALVGLAGAGWVFAGRERRRPGVAATA